MSSILKIPYCKNLNDMHFEKTYVNTPENRSKVARKISELWTLFLTKEAHDENAELYQALSKRGIHLAPEERESLFPVRERLDDFKIALKDKIETALVKESKIIPYVKLSVEDMRFSDTKTPEERLLPSSWGIKPLSNEEFLGICADTKFLFKVMQQSLGSDVRYYYHFPYNVTTEIWAGGDELDLKIVWQSS